MSSTKEHDTASPEPVAMDGDDSFAQMLMDVDDSCRDEKNKVSRNNRRIMYFLLFLILLGVVGWIVFLR